ncbi:LOW QUALITY PROTEIN: single-minded homolog 1-like [Haliotis rubra]|uniref:LOW QUALITY PROTEIN: single-minded homolog 1-like n=1 Tax=Haliotis rubra TaxID=36100 RepID=UPI001EE510FC|nr:LOW QUALITY PROTEIN: single-minded homolog 1-like [Haliotis rubra]
MVEDWVIKTMYATKRRRRTVKSPKAPIKDPPKSNPSKRHRERLNAELDHLASLLPFEQSVISKLDKLSILRLAVSYLRTKSYFQTVLPNRYGIESHLMGRSHLFQEPGFSEGESILQALYGFLFVVTCDGEVFYASRTVEQYLGFHQSDIIHQSVMELIHSEDRDEFKRQLSWSSGLPQEKSNIPLHEVMLPENHHYLHRSFTVRFRCLLDNTSGFITLEINGWIRVLHGQNIRAEEPQLALFATCCPFGPLSLFDIPSRELTFKSKHKMDFSPITMDSRGKMMFGYADHELASTSGYDLVHPDDLSYFAAAHQELIKTGSSGLIAYRWLTKSFRWLWLQSSCKVIYKNSKPDFIICTHRQLTDDEGQDLFGKRGNEFKLPYPLLDMDLCAGFGFPEEDLVSKKPNKNKKKAQGREYSQNTKKRKGPCPLNVSYGGYAPFNYDTGDYKSDIVYPNNFGYDTDIYRSNVYGSLTGSMYPSSDAYRLESDKHSLSNGYILDPRQYQPSLPYSTNSYADIITSAPKYGLDYGYGFDLAKKGVCEELPFYENDSRKYGYDFHHHERFPSRLNGSLEPVDLRSASVYNANSFMNTIEGAVAPPCMPSSTLFRSVHNQGVYPKDNKMDTRSSPDAVVNGQDLVQHSLNHRDSSVIKSAGPGVRDNINLDGNMTPNVLHNSNKTPDMNGSVWGHCGKGPPAYHQRGSLGSGSDRGTSPAQSDLSASELSSGTPNKNDLVMNTRTSPKITGVPASVIHSNPSCDKQQQHQQQSVMGGIPVPVVKASPWVTTHHYNNNAYTDKDWGAGSDMYACASKRAMLADSVAHQKHLALKSVTDRGDNPLLSFSEMTHTLLSSTH